MGLRTALEKRKNVQKTSKTKGKHVKSAEEPVVEPKSILKKPKVKQSVLAALAEDGVDRPASIKKGKGKAVVSSSVSAEAPTVTFDTAPAKESAKDPNDFVALGLPTSDDEDSSDDDRQADDEAIRKAKSELSQGLADSMPKLNKSDEAVRQRLDKAKKDPNQKPGVIYLGRLPRAFAEKEMRSYFGQFGEVTRLRLARSTKTGGSKHYGYIEFAHESVAEIVAETMNNYLLAGHLLQCKVVPPAEVHPRLWIGANKKSGLISPGFAARTAHNAPKDEAKKAKIAQRLLSREAKKRAKLTQQGIEYDFEGYAASKRKRAAPASEEPVLKKANKRAKTTKATLISA
ncbi:uncharacterized protein L969DRAFT_84682 [Mixia osmundae IAM 14324]|uniref:RRM domain-containing protein n=1 Tax=Mixia osmundae (strain CBS 9802 / IAM 14324 / JCM 22182 / KY 12970) TaxID=764103 RepID=G7DTM1_MIXOS|nr:uncharacterized protein L969DRAFT_84682 [Mixia osmundae IAM 14324]KEI42795.1 hypothetical protein L969DRAFT_84682 [Mixia osmundae IAM 14324]GAA93868.1 hypothetical protein E5Q_00514 [Mixia osmundae IAM 14324]